MITSIFRTEDGPAFEFSMKLIIIVESCFSSPSSSSPSSVGSIERLSGDPGSAPHLTISHVWQGGQPRVCVPVCAHTPPAALSALARSSVLHAPSDARLRSRPQNARKLLLEKRRYVFKRCRTVDIYHDEKHSPDLKPA